MKIVKYLLIYISIGVLCFILFINGIFDFLLNVLKNELLVIILPIVLMNVMFTLIMELSNIRKKIRPIKTIIHICCGIVISCVSFFCSAIAAVTFYMQGMG